MRLCLFAFHFACSGAVFGDAAESAELSPGEWRSRAIAYVNEILDLADRSDCQYELTFVLARAGSLDEARHAASQVVTPQKRVYAYSFVAKQHGNGSDLARLVLEECKTGLTAKNSATLKYWMPYLVTAYAESGLAAEAVPLVEQLSEPFQQERSLISVFTSLLVAGKTQAAEHYAAAHLNQEQTQRGVADAVRHLASAGRVDEALAFSQRLIKGPNNDNALVALSEALSKKDRPVDATAVIKKVADAHKRVSAIGTADVEQASRQSVDALKKQAAQAKSREHRTALTEKVVQALAAEGRVAEANAAIDDLIRTIENERREAVATKFGVEDDSVAIAEARALHFAVARELVKRGALRESRDQVGRAREAIVGLKPETGLSKNLLTNALVSAEISAENLQGALDVVEVLKREAFNAGSQTGDGNLVLSAAAKQVAVAQIQSGDVAGAMETAALIAPAGGRSLGASDLLGDVAAALIAAGEVDAAKRLLTPQGSTANEAEAYRDAGSAMALAGRSAELAAWINEIENPTARAMACLGAAEPRR